MDEKQIIEALAAYIKQEMEAEDVCFDDVAEFLVCEAERILNPEEFV